MNKSRKILSLCLTAATTVLVMWRLTVTARVAAFSTTLSQAASRRTVDSSSVLTSLFKKRPLQSYGIAYEQRKRYVTTQFASATAGDNESSSSSPSATNTTTHRTWNLGGLQKEVSRLSLRCHKKIGKTRQRLDQANQEVERLTSDPNACMDDLQACPNVDALEADLRDLQSRLKNLNKLEVLLGDIKGKGNNVVLPDHVSELAVQLEVNDEPPQRAVKITKKEKGPRNMQSFRLPYRRYYTKNKTEIRVGKQAEDNDELSLSHEHRDSADWWMHASGCPGSHVVIRCHDQNLDEEVVLDAAALAARQSKCNGNNIKISMTRARDVKKPPGAKAGLVQLTGQVRTISVNMKEAQERLDRLDATVLVN